MLERDAWHAMATYRIRHKYIKPFCVPTIYGGGGDDTNFANDELCSQNTHTKSQTRKTKLSSVLRQSLPIDINVLHAQGSYHIKGAHTAQ